ncbi:hypothetical protein AQUCO_00100394v1 [Aquilegia coerulea]|uniref:glutaredoxin-dependent peroxiredoxin n=1 Tax=Aquilegia coerulea TaxID=218851 RepID=A0A2G5FA40_AQUCA|nr:hypothetical protein AQUCO_00100394v1 [Aquilegia coerulea]
MVIARGDRILLLMRPAFGRRDDCYVSRKHIMESVVLEGPALLRSCTACLHQCPHTSLTLTQVPHLGLTGFCAGFDIRWMAESITHLPFGSVNYKSATQHNTTHNLVNSQVTRKEKEKKKMAPIEVGSKIPDGTLAYFDEENNLKHVSIHDLATGKTVILFGVPGAFTPTCSNQHVPGFIQNAEELKSKGVDEILLISGNIFFSLSL